MTATLRLKVNAGAPVAAKPAPEVQPGNALQLVLSSTTGVDKVRWRIISYPDGFDPSGSWLLVGTAWECYGVDGSSQISLSGSGFDTYLFEAILNDGLAAGVADASLTLRGGAVVRSAAGLRQLAYLETDHVDTDREWVSAIRELITAADGGSTVSRQSHADAVLWYPLEETAAPFESHGTSDGDLAISGTYSAATPGPLGKCLTLFDSGLTGADDIGLGSGSCTIWAWVIPPEVTGPRFCWGKVKKSDSSPLFTLSIEASLVTASITASSLVIVPGTDKHPPIAGVPNLLVATYNSTGGKVYLYVNGIYVDDDSASGSVTWVTETPGTTTWVIGGSLYTDNFVGRVLEAGGDSRAYDGTEIAEMYRRGMGWRA